LEVSIVFTDLDRTLLEPDGRLGQEAAGAVAQLRELGIPVVPLTSKTKEELQAWLEVLNAGGVGVFENGAGVVTPAGVETLPGAVPLECLSEIFADLRQRLGPGLVPLHELPDGELTLRTGLEGEAIRRALARGWDLPFLAPIAAEEGLRAAVQDIPAVRLLRGGSFWHLCGRHDKGGAVPRVVEKLGRPGRTVGLGDAPNDAGFLGLVDVPVLVPGPFGVDQCLRDAIPAARVAPQPFGEGWAAAVRAILDEAPDGSSGEAD